MNITELKALADDLVPLWDNGSFEREDAEQARDAINELIDQLEDAQKCGNGAGCCFKESKIESLEFQLENAQGEIRALRATEAGLLGRLGVLEMRLTSPDSPAALIERHHGIKE